ncbi:NACHT domain-containing protein [Comamonas aquatica]|uniref:NACHT domain-containing protein n=1 Tax=Comamonas aquatica TaxID=225991 RepID=UPI002447827D|nr:NACHT domain-containing protein [Comamonas aquatica]MDH0899544.1 NACHT domain-containing protein [Comamonas aquatica]
MIEAITDIALSPAKAAVMSAYEELNRKVESYDLTGKYRGKHFEIIKNNTSEVKILGMQQPLNLVDIYYQTSVSTEIKRRIYTDEWKQINNKKTALETKLKNTIPADKYIEDNNKVVILGGPGAGKTTLLKYLALSYMDKVIFQKTNLKTPKIPIYIHLPSLIHEDLSIIDYISSILEEKTDQYAINFIERISDSGDAIFLLDSLDEVPQDHKKTIIEKINTVTRLYSKSKYVLTCRTADYIQTMEGFTEVEVSKLTEQAISSIIYGWFKKENKEKAERLISLLKEDKSISKLTETPLLLGLLCIQYRNDLALPKRRSELYRRCVDALLRDWDASRNFRRQSEYSQLSDDRKEMIFEYIAGKTSEDQIEYEFPESKAIEAINQVTEQLGISNVSSRNILQEIESHHGIVEKCSVDLFQFSHGTMHEYFIARHIVHLRQELAWVKKKHSDSSCQTVIIFICSIMPDPSPILEFLLNKSNTSNFKNFPALANKINNLLLLHRCLCSGISINLDLRKKINKHIIESQRLCCINRP